MTLSAQQKQFQHSILSGECPTMLLRDSAAGCRAGLHIYQDAYRLRLAEALRDNYSVLHRLLGDDAFRELACAYIEHHPSRHPSIRWLGDRLTDFLLSTPGLVPHPALVDLARMEWALRMAFDAADRPLLTVGAMMALDQTLWPSTTFAVHPSLSLLELTWEVEPVWQALSEDENAETDMPAERPHTLLVWRRDLETHWRSLDAQESLLLNAAVAGKPFDELCLLVAESVDEEQAAALAAGLLRRWIEDGLLITPE